MHLPYNKLYHFDGNTYGLKRPYVNWKNMQQDDMCVRRIETIC